MTFVRGSTERFDAVVVAERVGSSTRELIFPNENDPRWMDMTIAFFTVPRTATDDRLWRWYNATGGRGVTLRPDMHRTTRAMLIVQGPSVCSEQVWVTERRKACLRLWYSYLRSTVSPRASLPARSVSRARVSWSAIAPESWRASS